MELDERGVPISITAVPFYFLTSHATDLFLKAALLKRGIEEESLRKFDYRHNLTSLLIELQATGVSISEKTV